MGLEGQILDLIQKSGDKGERATIFHLFSGDKELGKVVISSSFTCKVGDIDAAVFEKFISYVHPEKSKYLGRRVNEFLLEHGKLSLRVVSEILEPAPHLIVFGAGHVGQAVSVIGALCGYKVVVIDDRREFLTRERFPDKKIEFLQGGYDGIVGQVNIPSNSAIVIVTRGHQFDEICLKQVLDLDVEYIGMIGSRRRVLAILGRLAGSGLSERLLERVHAPIGLKIGAVSPQEIAIAIVAEIISVMNGPMLTHVEERRES